MPHPADVVKFGRSGGRTGAGRRRGGCLLRSLLLAGVIAGALWIFRERALTALGGYLVASDPPAAADAVLVLGGDPAERAWEAADLYREGWAPRIVLTTPLTAPAVAALAARGVVLAEEPQLARQVLQGLGVPAEAVLPMPEFVNSTESEARAFRAFAAGRGWRRVLVVSSPFHTRRSRTLFRQVMRETGIEVRVIPSRHGQYRAADWWRGRQDVLTLIIEYQKLLFYALPGHAR